MQSYELTLLFGLTDTHAFPLSLPTLNLGVSSPTSLSSSLFAFSIENALAYGQREKKEGKEGGTMVYGLKLREIDALLSWTKNSRERANER